MTVPEYSLRDIRDTAILEERVFLPVEAINVLTQVRKTFNGIAELASAIRHSGQMNPGLGTILTRHSAQKYLEIWNAIYQTSHTLRDLRPILLNGKKRYVILIAGERRYRAVSRARDLGLTQEFNGQYRITLHTGLKAAQALELQIQENLHDRVPPQEEARAVRDLYLWHTHQANAKDQKVISYTELGKRIGKTPEWISRALRFCSLPEKLQRLADVPVNDGGFPYGMLVELARLAEGFERLGKPHSQDDLHMIAGRAIAKRQSTKDFSRWVSNRLQAEEDGQGSLFGENVEEARRPIRKIVAPEMIRARLADNAYFKRLLHLYAQGAFGDDNPFDPEKTSYSADSPARLMVKMLSSFEQAIPVVRESVLRNKREILEALGKAEDVIAEYKVLAEALAVIEED